MIRKINVHYFKWTGKFYTEGELEIEDGTEATTKSGTPTVANMYLISEHIRKLQQQGELPGLSKGSHWNNGIIWFDCDDGYPCLIVPKYAQEVMEKKIDEEI